MHKYTNISRSKSIDDEISDIINQKGNNSFVEKNYSGKKWVTHFFLPLSTLISMITAYPALFVWMFQTTNNTTFSAAFAILVGLAIEAGKWTYVIPTIDDISDKVWMLGKNFRAMFFWKSAISVAFLAASVFLSIRGAADVTAMWIDKTQAPSLLTEATVNESFNNRIAAQNKIIARAEKMTWRGRVIEKGQSLIQQANTEIIAIETQKREAIKQMKIDNQGLIAAHQFSKNEMGQKAIGIGGIGELLFLFFAIYLTTYSRGVYREEINKKLEAEGKDNPSHEGTISSPPPSVQIIDTPMQPAIAAKKIGFKHYPDKQQDVVQNLPEIISVPFSAPVAPSEPTKEKVAVELVKPALPKETEVFDVKYKTGYAITCFRRAQKERKLRKTEKARQRNQEQFEDLVNQLEPFKLVPHFFEDEEGLMDVEFKEKK